MIRTTLGQFWAATIIIAVGTFLIRFSFIQAMERLRLPGVVVRSLKYIPAAVLSAIVVPAALLHQGAVHAVWGHERLIAAAVAGLAAWRFKNMLATVAAGMVSLWALQALG